MGNAIGSGPAMSVVCVRYLDLDNNFSNPDSFYENFTNTTFRKIPIPHLTPPMRQKFFH